MGSPVHFIGVNKTLTAPRGQDETQCSDLPVFHNGTYSVSRWELTPAEQGEIARTGCIYVAVYYPDAEGFRHRTQPPVYVGSEDGVREMIADAGVWRRVKL